MVRLIANSFLLGFFTLVLFSENCWAGGPKLSALGRLGNSCQNALSKLAGPAPKFSKDLDASFRMAHERYEKARSEDDTLAGAYSLLAILYAKRDQLFRKDGYGAVVLRSLAQNLQYDTEAKLAPTADVSFNQGGYTLRSMFARSIIELLGIEPHMIVGSRRVNR